MVVFRFNFACSSSMACGRDGHGHGNDAACPGPPQSPSLLLAFDARRLDDRPPLRDIGLLQSREPLRCLLLAVVEFLHAPDEMLPPLSARTTAPAGLPTGAYLARVKLQEGQFKLELLQACAKVETAAHSEVK